jgi:hypothetical protein
VAGQQPGAGGQRVCHEAFGTPGGAEAPLGRALAAGRARRFGALNMAFFHECHAITSNLPLRESCARLFLQTAWQV